MRVLVVDDSAAMRAFLKMILRSVGCEVLQAANGLDALAKLEQEEAPDLVLLDWNMPVMDGYVTLRRMRGDERWRAAKIMMVTTETELGEMTRALEAGADEYLMKPFTREVLLDKLELLGLGTEAV